MNIAEIVQVLSTVVDVVSSSYGLMALSVALFCYVTLGVTWVFYLAVMHLKEERDRLKKLGKDFSTAQKVFGYPILIIGLLIDVFLNATVGTIIFIEPPRYDKKEWLFTGRVSRWNDTGGWRGDLARYICSHLLDPFEKGGHCS